ADAFAGLPGWHRWRELFDFAHIGVLSRPGVDALRPAELIEEVVARRVDDVAALHAGPYGKLIELAVTPLEISATRIRDLLAAGRDPRYLLPAGLFDDPGLLAPYRR
ncbi:MAG: nicotinic acid mononucleotide adenylyltransferase, partial [Xanthomonadaceae bacterium]|nr:nicotinic acid mononucleotide adenylyltransferase [Xanthomonadaceae bacterium]